MPACRRHFAPAQLRFITSSAYRRTKLVDSHRFRCGLLEVPRQFRQEGLSAHRALAEVRAAPPCPFVSCTFFLTREPIRDSLLEFSKETAAKRLQWKAKWTRQGEKARKLEKDTILTKRTYRSSANKGLSFLKPQKRTGF